MLLFCYMKHYSPEGAYRGNTNIPGQEMERGDGVLKAIEAKRQQLAEAPVSEMPALMEEIVALEQQAGSV